MYNTRLQVEKEEINQPEVVYVVINTDTVRESARYMAISVCTSICKCLLKADMLDIHVSSCRVVVMNVLCLHFTRISIVLSWPRALVSRPPHPLYIHIVDEGVATRAPVLLAAVENADYPAIALYHGIC